MPAQDGVFLLGRAHFQILCRNAKLCLDDVVRVFRVGGRNDDMGESDGEDEETDSTGWLQLIAEWNLHYRIRDVVAELLKSWLLNPPDGHAFAWLDYLKVGFLFFCPFRTASDLGGGFPSETAQECFYYTQGVVYGGGKIQLEGGVLGPSGAVMGPSRPGPARIGSARLGSARLGPARPGSARPGSARLGSARAGPARLGLARLGWLDSARLGPARFGSASPK